MISLQPDLQNRLLNELLRCPQFGSDDALRAIFSDGRLSTWQHNVPEASNPALRVSFLVSRFMDAWNTNRDNALALILCVLAEVGNFSDLYSLAGEVQAMLVRGKIAECERKLTQVKEHQTRGWSDPAYARRRGDELQQQIEEWRLAVNAFNQNGQQVKYQVNMTGTAVSVIGDGARITNGLNMGGDGNVVGNGNVVSVRDGRMQRHYNSLLEEYGAVNNQINATLDSAARLRLQRQSDHLYEQLVVLAGQLGINNLVKQESKTMVNYNDFHTKALALQAIRDMIALRKEFGLTVPQELLEDGKALRREAEAAAIAEKQTYAANIKQQLREVETAKEKRERLQRELSELGEDSTEI